MQGSQKATRLLHINQKQSTLQRACLGLVGTTPLCELFDIE